MRPLSLIALATAALLSAPALAQDQTPARPRGNGYTIYENYRFFHEDRARMADGRMQRAMEAAQQNRDVYVIMRAREGKPVQPRR